MQQIHYVNSFTALDLASLASVQADSIEMPRDGYDVLIERVALVAVNSSTNVIAESNFLVQFTEQGGSNRTLFVNPVHARNLVGAGQQPWDLPEPWLVPGASRLACTITSLAPVALDIYIAIHGKRVPRKAG